MRGITADLSRPGEGGRVVGEAVRILAELGTPLLIHQPNYSMFNRWIEEGLLDVLDVAALPWGAYGVLEDQ